MKALPRYGKRKLLYTLRNDRPKLREGIEQDPFIFLVDTILYSAIGMSASDIHLEQTKTCLRVRYRVDGVLHDQVPVDFERGIAVLSRIKVLASLDIAQRRLPQDGKIRLLIEGNDSREIDLRISTFPCLYGEKMVLRILDCRRNVITLENLGCSQRVLHSLYTIINKPQGLFLVTGPTGCGKTTTLYAILSKLNKSKKGVSSYNIMTMEDPIEYQIDGITQSQINTKAGFTFEVGLRSLFRQDPDIAMIGEIRDRQTAQIAIEAALTGHFVLSTLHTNDAIGAVARLKDMGIESFLLTASLTGVLAQRLVRLLCPHCKYKIRLNEKERQLLLNYGYDCDMGYRSKGCTKCFGLGYKGRIGVFELLIVDEALCRLIMNGVGVQEMRQHMINSGMQFLLNDALANVAQGVVGLDKVHFL